MFEGRDPGLARVNSVVRLLAELFSSEEPFLIVNNSLLHLLTLYQTDLIQADLHGNPAALLQTWSASVDEFKRDWLQGARDEIALFRGQAMAVVTEHATTRAHAQCEQRKRGVPAKSGIGRKRPATKKAAGRPRPAGAHGKAKKKTKGRAK